MVHKTYLKLDFLIDLVSMFLSLKKNKCSKLSVFTYVIFHSSRKQIRNENTASNFDYNILNIYIR